MQINTERLIIRPFREDDSRDLYEYLSKTEVVKYEPYPPCTYEQAVAEAVRRQGDQNFYAVALKSGKVIGNLYLAEGAFGTWELGYVFNNVFWGQGYAAESAQALLNIVFRDRAARRITAMCNPLNQASWKLLERLGFRREGHLIRNIYFKTDSKGEPIWQDTYEYAILKEEWPPERNRKI